MSLQKSFEAPTGATHASAYHKITGLTHNRVRNAVEINVSIYKDSAAKVAAKNPVGRKSYRLAGTDYNTYFANSVLDTVDQNHVERCYVYLKTLSDYSGASDV
jgi:hypothetical protein